MLGAVKKAVDVKGALVALGLEKKAPTKFTEERQVAYLQELARTGLKQRSAAAAGVSYRNVVTYRKIDKEFRRQCEMAEAIFAERLAAEATRRGCEGWEEPVYQKGEIVHAACEPCKGIGQVLPEGALEAGLGEIVPRKQWPYCKACAGTGKTDPLTIRKYDTQLLQMQLKAYDPRYQPNRQVDVNIRGGVLAVPMQMSAEEWADKYRGAEDAEVVACGKCGQQSCDC